MNEYVTFFLSSTCSPEEGPMREPMTNHRRLEERESGVGVSDSSGFLQGDPTPPILLNLYSFQFNIFFYFLISLQHPFIPHKLIEPETSLLVARTRLWGTTLPQNEFQNL